MAGQHTITTAPDAAAVHAPHGLPPHGVGDPAPRALSLADTGLDDAAREARPAWRYIAATIPIILLGAVPAAVVQMLAANLSSITAAYQTSQASWVITSSSILGALLMLPVGKLGDILGKKRVLMCQLLAILAGLLLCALTTNFSLLLVGSALGGLGATLQVSYYGIIRDTFPRRWIPMTIAVLVVSFSLAVPSSIMLGGYLTEHYSYHSMYLALAGFVLLATVLTFLLVPESPLRKRDRLDLNSIGLVAIGLFMVTYGLNESSVPGRGWSSGWTVGFLIGGVVLLIGWALYERQPEQSTMGVSQLTSRSVNSVLTATLLTGAMLFMIATLAPTIGVTPKHIVTGVSPNGQPTIASPGFGLGLTVFEYGKATLLPAIAGCVIVLLAGWWARHRGARLLLIVGPLLFAGGMLWDSTLTQSSGEAQATYIVTQAGINILLLAYPLLIIEAVPAHSGGVGLGLATIFQGIGGSIGTQIVATISASHVFVANPFTGQSVTSRDGVQLALYIGAAFGIVACLSAFLVPHGRTRSSGGALPTAAELAAPDDGLVAGHVGDGRAEMTSGHGAPY